ncbi:M23 family metallopeptidase [Microterricola viridarii]|uniref:M23 family metallopeptidase n=1 Tax=Microterricola viridarii TaxID=412690 RepID=UPI001F286338|nr:M23 family metallopeptidase [Microterricola viridarii]
MTRRRGRAGIGAGLAIALAATLAVGTPAAAAGFPSWEDVQASKANSASAQQAVQNIRSLIVELDAAAEAAQAESNKRSEELIVAQNQFDDAALRAAALQDQADASKATADAATKQAGLLAAQLYRSGGGDLSVNLFLDGSAGTAGGDAADGLLSRLGSMSKMVERSTDVYASAQTTTNTAAALGDQAAVATAAREKLRIVAEGALAAAVSAQQAADAALQESQDRSVVLDAQLAFMLDEQAKTTAGYEEGERQRIAAEKAAAEQRARDEAAAAGGGGGGGGGGSAGPGLGGGYIHNGWAVPASGRITDNYGPRAVICGSGGCSSNFHRGTDIGTGCYSPIYAASAGTVVYSGWNGTYGNWIKIDHGNGVSTGYAHIRDGGRFVGVGEWVEAGQNIASSGTTGASDGCHLHFEAYVNGNRTDAVPFMADRGVPLG